jgi:hypothetical protein
MLPDLARTSLWPGVACHRESVGVSAERGVRPVWTPPDRLRTVWVLALCHGNSMSVGAHPGFLGSLSLSLTSRGNISTTKNIAKLCYCNINAFDELAVALVLA